MSLKISQISDFFSSEITLKNRQNVNIDVKLQSFSKYYTHQFR